MAKKKKKDKEISFNNVIRNLTLGTIKTKLLANKTLKEDEIFHLSNILKEWYREINGEFVLDYVDEYSFTKLIDYTSDLFMLSKRFHGKEFDKHFKLIRNKLANELIEKDYKFEYFIAVNRICSIFDNMSLLPEYRIFDKIEPLTTAMFLFTLNISTYIYKFENKDMREFKETNNKVMIKYSKMSLLSEIEIKNVNYCYLNDDYNQMYINSLTKIMDSINKSYEIFMSKELSDDFKGLREYVYKLSNKYIESPFLRKDYSAIPNEEIKRIPKDRLYITPTGGIKFDILDKSHNIDSIELFEEEKRFYFNIYFINNGDILQSKSEMDFVIGELQGATDNEMGGELYTKDLLKVSFLIDKSVFNNPWDLGTVSREKKCVGCNIIGTPILLDSMTYTSLCCIYLAYYDPFKFKNEIRMYNIVKDKKGGYKRSEGFRIAHLRKLPKGYRSSPEAKLEAKKAGFNNIPEGYTFVSASNQKLEKKKQKRIVIE